MNSVFKATGILSLLLSLTVQGVESVSADPSPSLFASYPPVSCAIGPTDIGAEIQQLAKVLQDGAGLSGLANLKVFITDHPHASWTPSLRAHYAQRCRESGKYTEALENFEAAWLETKTDESDAGRAVADFTVAHWSQLLASLGRRDTLKHLFQETEGRTLSGTGNQALFDASREGLYTMENYTDISFRCGTFALTKVAKALGRRNFNRLLDEPSPFGGFSMTKLVEFSDKHDLGLVPVERMTNAPVVVPAVVHWRQNHYAAILDHAGEFVWLEDPTFEQSGWKHISVVNEESSGYFLVPQALVSDNYRRLTKVETDGIFGKGQPNSINDWKDEGCDKSPSSKGRSTISDCPPCHGMATWWVTEPYINVFIADEPLSYPMSTGENFLFRVTHKQRDVRPPLVPGFRPYAVNRNLGMTNASLSHTFLSSVQFRDPSYDQNGGPLNYDMWEALVLLPGGGYRFFSGGFGLTQGKEDRSKARLEPLSGYIFPTLTNTYSGPVVWGDDSKDGFQLIHPDGSRDIYNFVLRANPFLSAAEAFLTKRIDAQGRATVLAYESAPRGGSLPNVIRPIKIVDPDNRTNTLRYAHSSSPLAALVTELEDPYGRKAQFHYDTTGRLTNIVDAAGISSSLSYQGTNGLVSKLVTPYDTNTFNYYEAPGYQAGFSLDQGNLGGHDRVNRMVEVTDAQGAKELYMYRYETQLVPEAYVGEAPSGTPLAIDNGTATSTASRSSLRFRNSFYWGKKQFPALSTSLPEEFTEVDYAIARQRHWLDTDESSTVSDRLSLERAPSPDGVLSGQKTWFSYEGKDPAASHRVGTNSLRGLIAQVLPNGETQYTWYRYSTNGLATNVVSTYTDSDGSVGTRTNHYLYSANGIDLTKEIGPDGVVKATYGYNTNHQVIGLTNAVGDRATFSYDSTTRQLTSIKSASGLTITNRFYGTSNPQGPNDRFLSESVALEIGATNKFTYSGGLVRTFTDSRGLTVTNTWDNLLRLNSTTYPDGTFTSNRYHRLDLSANRDRMGKWSYFEHDALQHLVAVTNANTNVTRFGYCGCGSLEAVTNALQKATIFAYDNQLRRTGVNFPDTSSVSYKYDSVGRITNAVDGAGRSTAYYYNNQGLLTVASNALGRMLAVDYDIEDRPVRVTDENGVTVTNAFDNLNRIIARGYPDGGGVETFTYSTNLVRHTNQLGQFTHIGLDPAGREVAVTNANQEVTRFKYDASGNLTNLIDAKNQNTVWTNDIYGLVRAKFDALGNYVFSVSYDANGRLINRWTPEKGEAGFYYDAVGNLTDIDYAVSPDIHLTYDPVERLASMTDAVGTTIFNYTETGQIQSENGPWENDIVSYGYNQGLRSTLTLEQHGASPWSQTYGYSSAARRLESVTSPIGTTAYWYHPQKPWLVAGLGFPNTAYIANAYDALGQLTGTWLEKSDATTLNAHTYGYDLWGQRTAATNLYGDYRQYEYDKIGQLETAFGFEASGVTRLQEKHGYAYDPAGNLNSRTNNAFIQAFGNNDLNQLTSFSRSGTLTVAGVTLGAPTNVTINSVQAELYADGTFAQDGFNVIDSLNLFGATAKDANGRVANTGSQLILPLSANYIYDANGNLRTNSNQYYLFRTYDYDDENQVIRITEPTDWMTEFVYDGLKRLRVRKEFDWKNSAWVPIKEVRYVYDGNLVIQERDALHLPQVTYTRGLDLSGSLQGAGGIGGLLARTESSGSLQQSTAYYHADANGNITALIDAQQNIVAKYQYDPFGSLISSTGPKASANVYRFSSKEMHVASSLYYFGYRFYEPKLQRWINRDPISEDGGINLYRFVRNNPLNRVDPFGKSDFNRPPASISFNANQQAVQYGYPRADPRITAFDSDPFADLVAARDYTRDLIEAASYYLRHGLLPEELAEWMEQPPPPGSPEFGFPPGGFRLGKPCPTKRPANWPSWKNVKIDMDEVLSGHTRSGNRFIQSGQKTAFPDSWSPQQIERHIRQAYRRSSRVGPSQPHGAFPVRGQSGGQTIEMWVNPATRVIETAYPIY